MKTEELEIPGVLLARPERFEDDRGWFMEILREDAFGVSFVQGNHSHSRAGVLRGLHYHAKQSDAWYIVSGQAQVGVVDLRTRSEHPTALAVDMSSDDPTVLYIPPGVAHGFLAITELDLIYWVTHYFDNTDEHGVSWNDSALAVPWEATSPIISQRDANASSLDWDQVESRLMRKQGGGSNSEVERPPLGDV
jgi:dTDP-4-dehydrorhamnose 3,5-epimerase